MAKKKNKKGKRGKKKASNPNSVFNRMLRDADALNVTETESRLEKIINARRGKIVKVDPLIEFITSNSNRVENNKYKTKENEFTFRDGKAVKRNTDYHIHYTKDLNEWYMTGTKHARSSKIINRVKNNTDFQRYNLLNKQSKLSIPPSRIAPTATEIKAGAMKRYFAIKTNDNKSPVFEISKDNFGSSPLYDYASVQWKISGTKDSVSSFNELQIEKASEEISSLTKLLSPFQMYKPDSNLNLKESVTERLNLKDPDELTLMDFFAQNRKGKTKKRGKSKKSKTKKKKNTSTQNTSTQTTSTQASGYNAASGPPAGGSSGGGGGGY